jgi:dipeptidyl aminopeptidase/acylaminoacyl peptidase
MLIFIAYQIRPMRISLSFLVILSAQFSFSQKKVIDPSVYNAWKKNENQIVSNDGNYVAYEINPHRGDGFLYVYNVRTEHLDSFPRGKEAKFSFESDYLAFKITPGFDTLRNCELNKEDKKKWPKDTLVVYMLRKDTLIKYPLLKSFTVGAENNWLSYVVDENEFRNKGQGAKNKDKDKRICKKSKKKDEKPDYKSDGKVLTVVNPTTGRSFQYKDVTDHVISENGKQLAFTEHRKEKTDSVQLVTVDLESGKITPLGPKHTAVKSMTFNKTGELLAFHASSDTNKVKLFNLQLYKTGANQLSLLADTTSTMIPAVDAVSEHRRPLFTKDGKMMFFGVTKRPEPEKKDTLLESEKVELDIWHYKDKRLQSQQLVELKRDQKKTDLYAVNLADLSILKIADDTLRVNVSEDLVGNYLHASSNEQYAFMSQWETAIPDDHYRISISTGAIELIKKGVVFDGKLSPTGTFFTYFDAKNGQYYLQDLISKKESCITCSVNKVNWQVDVNGMPMIADPFGIVGYDRGERNLYVRSEYDIWTYSIGSGSLVSLTEREGESKKIRFEPKLWSEDSIYIDYKNLILSGFDEKTKGTHLYEVIDHGDHTDLKPLVYTDHKVTFLTRSKNTETVIFRKMSLSDYPEVRVTRDLFAHDKVISITNPQQSEYNWATVELVQWKAYDGTPLEGLLYKPENFDPSKKYPLIVYYYELHSDDLHNHSAPKPTASIIYPTEYASAGYLVFIPDIRYKPGYPAKGAYNCIMSGTDHVLKLVPAIDSTRMGLQGQSWGGYQTAMLITMTTRFKAAMAGAPVSNMFSAYGGIRWGSGMNRQFQYERTQSRIGKTIWESPELYMENSPLFHLPKVKTPLLIMANDKDGAVPWYQGIELFTGMKRLGKPCWMFNYNGDDHNLMENANRMDLSIRMRQFFDHYLLGAPAPQWLTVGIPAIDKGKVTGY